MTVRSAEAKDLDALCGLAERFVGESDFNLTYSDEDSRQSFWSLIHDDDEILLISDNDGAIGGIVLGMVGRDFCVETCGYVMKFYVEREFRGLGVSRELLDAFERAAVAKGATILFASATAGMGPRVERLYVRLFEHHGYNVLGRVLVKECNGQV